MRKQELRKEILDRLKKQPEDSKITKENAIRDKFLSSEEFLNNRVIMFYVSMAEEVDTWTMIKEAIDAGKTVAVPYNLKETNDMVPVKIRDLKKDLEKGSYGIYQPKNKDDNKVPLKDIELVIVPGVAFDTNKNRLGRGKGYYDKFLKKLPKKTVTIGLCFDFQIVKNLPVDHFDLPVDKIITN
ncbi:MAG: 5-formyltetrahydrofolate cyclo-ligase [Candidatus Omnitrophica bacterium]|nr:5-formyltetrahydrofolate cyclo-ligase [Candidatus Omnitrophota bacterium]